MAGAGQRGGAGALRGRRRALAAAGALVFVGAAAYANSFRGRFFLDDSHTILQGPQIVHLRPLRLLLGTRPVASLSLALNYQVSGADPWSYHAVNLAVHLLAALALFAVVRRTLRADRLAGRFGRVADPLALAVAAIWMVHPLLTGAVTYVTQRFESMMGMFYLLTLYCAIRAAGGRGGAVAAWSSAAVLACALGMGCKEVMVTAPLMVAIYDRVFVWSSWRRVLRRRAVLYVALAATWVLLWRPWAGGPPPGAPASAGFEMAGVSPVAYALTQFEVIVRYLRLAVLPVGLCLDYWWPLAEDPWAIVPPAILVAALAAATVVALRRRPGAGFAGAWFFLILAPTSSIMPIADPLFEHRMYLPLAGVVALVVCVAWRLVFARLDRRVGARAGAAAAVVVTAVLGTLTHLRNRDYADEVRMWTDVVAERPENPRGRNNLALALIRAGRPREALGHLREALRIFPEYVDANENLGLALSRCGREADAIGHLTAWLRSNPNSPRAHHNLGVALDRQGRLEEAVGHYRAALRHDRYSAEAHSHLGAALGRLGRDAEALKHLRRAVAIRPHYANGHYNLGLFHAKRGRRGEARREFLATVRLDVGHGRALWQLAHDALRSGRPEEALRLFEAAARAEPHRHTFQADWADVCAQLGRFGEAVAAIGRAIDAAGAAGDARAVAVYARALEAYRARRLPPPS